MESIVNIHITLDELEYFIRRIFREETERLIQDSPLTTKQAAKMLHKTTNTVLNYVKQGKLIPISPIGHPRFREEDVRKFIKR